MTGCANHRQQEQRQQQHGHCATINHNDNNKKKVNALLLLYSLMIAQEVERMNLLIQPGKENIYGGMKEN
jgi:hypothetical protein